MIVRWGLPSLPELLDELSIGRPLLVTTRRWSGLDLGIARRFDSVQPHAELQGVEAAAAAAHDADGLVALGGGSAIDTAKAVSVRTALRVVSVPTTYSGAEWTGHYGTRDAATLSKPGGGGALVTGIVYDTNLTLDLPQAETGGTALNALAHCVEALYTRARSEPTDNDALIGANLISTFLAVVSKTPRSIPARRGLLEAAMHAGMALRAGMGVGHAMAQALGGRYGLSHGTMNALCLPHALEFNLDVAPRAIRYLGAAMDTTNPVERVAELARLGGPTRLRDYGVPREDLTLVAATAAERPAALANPRPASAEAIAALLNAAW